METLESSRVCRLCGKQSGISINIFDKSENHLKKINAILPIMVHEIDLLPKHMCHRCSYKLEEFYKFYVDCLKTDADLKSQLSWMSKEDSSRTTGVPMVHIENVKVKIEPPDYEDYRLDSIVDNVNYINSVSSVTFPYPAYARCRCCCDNKDQSKQTSPVDYGKTLPRCNRVAGARKNNAGCGRKLQAAKRNLANDVFQDQRCVEQVNTDVGRYSTTSSGLDVDGGKFKSPRNYKLTSETVVHNLRPRKGSVDYVGTKKKATASGPRLGKRSKVAESTATFDVGKIKVERVDDYERTLRPRKRPIDYFERRRKCSKANRDQRLQGEKYPAKSALQNLSKRAPELEEDGKLAIKQEPLYEAEDGETADASARTQGTANIGDLVERVNALPENVLANLKNDLLNYNRSAQLRKNLCKVNTFKRLKSLKKSKIKSEKIGLNRVAPVTCSPKYLRSQDVFLRNGKIRKFEAAESSGRKLQRSFRSVNEAGKSVLKSIKGTANARRVSKSVNLISNNIKHYCEECNITFANKELFKLHVCYN